jgi:protease-4
MNPPPIPKRSPHTGLWVTLVILGACLGLSLLINIGLFAGRSFQGLEFAEGGGADEFPQLKERWSYGRGNVRAARISLKGLIFRQEEGGLFGPRIDKVRDILNQIRAAANDERVRAIVFEVDSPGGAITPSDEIYMALKAFKESSPDRVVVAFTRDMAASGGYYTAVAADWIIAEPTCIIGSIGVIMQTFNWKKLTDDIGIKDVTIKSGKNKDLLNPFQETSPIQLAILQEMIDDMHSRFKRIVQEHRNIPTEKLDELADGRIFSADTALDHNLINQIGYWDDVVQRTKELLNEESVLFFSYYQETDLFSLLTQVRSPLDLDASTWYDLQTPKMLYLWSP